MNERAFVGGRGIDGIGYSWKRWQKLYHHSRSFHALPLLYSWVFAKKNAAAKTIAQAVINYIFVCSFILYSYILLLMKLSSA